MIGNGGSDIGITRTALELKRQALTLKKTIGNSDQNPTGRWCDRAIQFDDIVAVGSRTQWRCAASCEPRIPTINEDHG